MEEMLTNFALNIRLLFLPKFGYNNIMKENYRGQIGEHLEDQSEVPIDDSDAATFDELSLARRSSEEEPDEPVDRKTASVGRN